MKVATYLKDKYYPPIFCGNILSLKAVKHSFKHIDPIRSFLKKLFMYLVDLLEKQRILLEK